MWDDEEYECGFHDHEECFWNGECDSDYDYGKRRNSNAISNVTQDSRKRQNEVIQSAWILHQMGSAAQNQCHRDVQKNYMSNNEEEMTEEQRRIKNENEWKTICIVWMIAMIEVLILFLLKTA